MKKLTQEQKQQFDEQGYVFPFRAFDAARATGYRERIEAYERSANIDANRTLKIKGYLAFPWLMEIAKEPEILDAVEDIIGPDILLFGASIPPLLSASTHVVADDRRTRKLLLHKQEIDKLIGAVERKGYTIIPTAMYWKHNRVKLEIALARGKQDHDKRDAEKERDWNREKQRTMRQKNPLG
jgi:SsrA-binding protein